MKLKILAAVVAGTFTFPMVAQAGTIADTMSIDGDIGIFYSDSTESINELGTEINFDGSAEQDGITYMGHMELDVNGTRENTLRMDEVSVGAKGGFGEVWLGDVDNACDKYDTGSNDIWLGGQSGSCRGSDVNNIRYSNSFGGAEFAVSHNPGEDQSAIGARFAVGPAKIGLAYEDGITLKNGKTDEGLVSYFISADMNGVGLNLEGNDDDDWGVNATYSMSGNTFWVGYGDDGSDDDRIGLGYRRSHGKMDYIIEHQDHGSSDETIVGMRYRF